MKTANQSSEKIDKLEWDCTECGAVNDLERTQHQVRRANYGSYLNLQVTELVCPKCKHAYLVSVEDARLRLLKQTIRIGRSNFIRAKKKGVSTKKLEKMLRGIQENEKKAMDMGRKLNKELGELV